MITSISLDEILQRISTYPQSNIWLAIVANNSEHQELIQNLEETLSIFTGYNVVAISGQEGIKQLNHQIQNVSEEFIIIFGLEYWNQEDWYNFDYFRSRLNQEKHGGILIISPNSAKMMLTYAPNFVSWLGSRVYRIQIGEELLNLEEREKRLESLREWSGLSDIEIITKAEKNQLPSDPEYGEWLLLLNREDLIGQ